MSKIQVVVTGNVSRGVSKEFIQAELAKHGIVGDVEIVEVIEGDVIPYSPKLTIPDLSLDTAERISPTKNNNKQWKKSFFWE